METRRFSFQESNKRIPAILLIGIALGIANYSLGVWPNLGQSLIQQIVISFVIGYSLVFISYNHSSWFRPSVSKYRKHALLLFLFCLLGIIGTESQDMVRKFLFQEGSYTPFSMERGVYVFNAILSVILGIVFLKLALIKETKEDLKEESEEVLVPEENIQEDPLLTIPIKKGEVTTLHSSDEVIYFEAYDNYSFLHDLSGNKYLCNYSLAFLEKRLSDNFLRVHRKYLLNKAHIYQIKPHLKGRYVIVFKDKAQKSITSSSSYTDIIKSLTRL